MDIKRRKKYFLALAQATTTTPTTTPASPTSPTAPESPKAPETPAPAFDASIFRNLNTLWRASNAEKIKQIINVLNKGIHVFSQGRASMNTVRNNNFNFSSTRDLMPASPGKDFIIFVQSFFNAFLLVNATKDNVSELTSEQKKQAVKKALDAFNILKSATSSIKIKDSTFNEQTIEGIRTLLNNIDTNLQPTVKPR